MLQLRLVLLLLLLLQQLLLLLLYNIAGLGDSYSSQFSNSLAEGKTSSSTGVIAGTLTGQAKGTVGSVATSAKSSSDTQALSTSKAGMWFVAYSYADDVQKHAVGSARYRVLMCWWCAHCG